MATELTWTPEQIFKFIQIRAKYKVDPHLNSPDFVYQKILSELGLCEVATIENAASLWDNLVNKYKELSQPSLEPEDAGPPNWEYFSAMHDVFLSWSVMEMEAEEPEIDDKTLQEIDIKTPGETVEEEAARLEEVFRKNNIVSLQSLQDFDATEEEADTLEELLSDEEDLDEQKNSLEFSVVDEIWTEEKLKLFINVRGSKSSVLSGKDHQVPIYEEILETIDLKDQVTPQKAKKKWCSLVDKYWELSNLQVVSDLSDSKADVNESEETRMQNSERDKELLWPFYSCMKKVMKTEDSLVPSSRLRKSPEFSWSLDITKKFIRMRVAKHPEISIKGNNTVYQEILEALSIADKVKVGMARKKWNYLVKRYQDEELAGGERTWAFMKDMKNVMRCFKDYSKNAKLRSRASPEFLWPNDLTRKFIQIRTKRHADFTEGNIQRTYLEIMEELGLENILFPNQLRKKWNYLVSKHKELSCTTGADGTTPAPNTWPFYDDMETAIASIPGFANRVPKANLTNIWTPETLKKFIALRGSKRSNANYKLSIIFDEILEELGLTGTITPFQARKKWNYLYTKYLDLSSPHVEEYSRQSWPYFTDMQNAVGSLPLSQLPPKRYQTSSKALLEDEQLKKVSKKCREYTCYLCGKNSTAVNDFFMFEHDQTLFHTQMTVLEILAQLIGKKILNLQPTTCLCSSCTNIVNDADAVIAKHVKIKQETHLLYLNGIALKQTASSSTNEIHLEDNEEDEDFEAGKKSDSSMTLKDAEKEENVTYSKRGRKRKATSAGIKTEPSEEAFLGLEFDDDSEDEKKKKRGRRRRGRPVTRTTLIGRGLGNKYPASNKRLNIPMKELKVYHCPECKQTFKKYAELVAHRKDAHTVIDTSTLEVQETVLENGVITYFNKDKANNSDTCHECKDCQKQFLRKDDLWYHQEMAHTDGKGRAKTAFKDRSYNCEECGEKFLFKYKLKMHINYKHLNDAGQSANDFTCGQCGCKLGSLPGLTFHMRKHHNKSLTYRKNTEYLCSDCGYLATSNKKLKEHQEAHCGFSSKPKVQCEICGKTVLKVSLKMHKAKMHSDFKEQCDRCGERYATKTDLLRHINVVHLHILLYTCSVCNERFPTSDSLRYHRVKVHEKPSFYCQGCGKCYKRIGELNTHIKRAHNDRRKAEVCQYCGKQYYDRSGLRNHLVNKHSVPQEMTYSENYLRKKRVDGLPLAKHMEKRMTDPKHQTPSFSILQHQLEGATHQTGDQPQQPNNQLMQPRVDEAAEAARNLTAYSEMTTAPGTVEEDSALVVTEITESPQVDQSVLVDPLAVPHNIMHHPGHMQHGPPMAMHHHMQHQMQHNMRLNVLYQMNMHHPGAPSHINM